MKQIEIDGKLEFEIGKYYLAYVGKVYGKRNKGFIFFTPFFQQRTGGKVLRIKWYNPFDPEFRLQVYPMGGLQPDWEYFEMTDEEVQKHVIIPSI